MKKHTFDPKKYYAKLRDPRWQRIRLKVMERDHYACLTCGAEVVEP